MLLLNALRHTARVQSRQLSRSKWLYRTGSGMPGGTAGAGAIGGGDTSERPEPDGLGHAPGLARTGEALHVREMPLVDARSAVGDAIRRVCDCDLSGSLCNLGRPVCKLPAPDCKQKLSVCNLRLAVCDLGDSLCNLLAPVCNLKRSDCNRARCLSCQAGGPGNRTAFFRSEMRLLTLKAMAAEEANAFLEEVNSGRLLPAAQGNYEVARQLAPGFAPTNLNQTPLLKAA